MIAHVSSYVGLCFITDINQGQNYKNKTQFVKNKIYPLRH